MIPSTTGFLRQDFEIVEQPTKTYGIDLKENRVRGYIDEQEAMEQAVFKALQTERCQYTVYSWNYGIETLDLYGEPVSWICPELERRVSEALLGDPRIKGVDHFEFNLSKKGVIHVTFTVHTVFGEITAEKAVNF